MVPGRGGRNPSPAEAGRGLLAPHPSCRKDSATPLTRTRRPRSRYVHKDDRPSLFPQNLQFSKFHRFQKKIQICWGPTTCLISSRQPNQRPKFFEKWYPKIVPATEPCRRTPATTKIWFELIKTQEFEKNIASIEKVTFKEIARRRRKKKSLDFSSSGGGRGGGVWGGGGTKAN